MVYNPNDNKIIDICRKKVRSEFNNKYLEIWEGRR